MIYVIFGLPGLEAAVCEAVWVGAVVGAGKSLNEISLSHGTGRGNLAPTRIGTVQWDGLNGIAIKSFYRSRRIMKSQVIDRDSFRVSPYRLFHGSCLMGSRVRGIVHPSVVGLARRLFLHTALPILEACNRALFG